MNLDILKEHYFFELTRKQQLESGLTLPVAVLIALGGVAFSYGRTFSYAFNFKIYLFAGALLGAVLAFLCVFYYLIRATHRFMYEVIPSSLELLSYYEQAKDYYQSLTMPFKADEELESKLKWAYAEASSKNRDNNISKAAYLYRANMGLVVGAVFLAICAGPYLADEFTKPLPVQKIEIIKGGELRK